MMPSPETIDLFSKIGVIGILVVMWWRAEARADKERALNETLTRESVAASVKFESTLATLTAILTGRKADT
jgi:hypothetical protein